LRVEQTECSLLPDLVLLRPVERTEVVRLRYLEPEGGSPVMRSVYHPEVSSTAEAEVERHLATRLGRVVGEVFSAVLWIELGKLPGPH
jgi:hypothetical protein